jgi:hypothetical protein
MEPDEGFRSVNGEATGEVLAAGSVHLVNEVVRAAAGGPQQYSGRLMGDARTQAERDATAVGRERGGPARSAVGAR